MTFYSGAVFNKIDFSGAPLPQVVAKLKLFMDTTVLPVGAKYGTAMMAIPEVDALVFYCMNHMVAKRSASKSAHKMDKVLADDYRDVVSVRALRMFYYMLLICTRESRHSQDAHTSGDFWPVFLSGDSCDIDSAFQIKKFHKTIKGKGSSGAVQALLDGAPEVKIGDYTQWLVDVFYKTKYSGGYGGKAWGAVADVLNNYVKGVISAEAMLDTAFTLAHNNGPIFNKGMMYHSYGSYLLQILDLQRAGMTPKFLGTNAKFDADPAIASLRVMLQAVVPEDVAGPIDWDQVKKLGAIGDYSDEGKAKDNAESVQITHGFYLDPAEHSRAIAKDIEDGFMTFVMGA